MQIRAVISGLIGSLGVTCALAQTAPSSTDDAWHFAVTPYLWVAGLNGNTRIGPLTELWRGDCVIAVTLANRLIS
jgi:hypothetical protein